MSYMRLKDAHITGISGASALKLEAGAKLALELVDGTDNELKAGSGGYGGIEAADGTELIIKGTGRLEARANNLYYAGIGGGNGAAGGSITIEGGTVDVQGGYYGAGIGGGGGFTTGGAGGTLEITGGTVYALSASSPAHIGFGTNNSASNGANASFTHIGGSGRPVIFAETINGNPAASLAIDGIGGVTVTMTTGNITVAGVAISGVITDVTVTLGSPFTVPNGATLTIPGGPPPPPLPSVPTFILELGGYNLINNGTVVNKGTVSGGTVSGSGTWTGQQP
jgi:hypothetical protein